MVLYLHGHKLANLEHELQRNVFSRRGLYNWFTVPDFSTVKHILFVWFDSLRPINNLSVKQGRIFLGWTSTMWLAQGQQRSDAGEALQSLIKHSTTEPLRSLCKHMKFICNLFEPRYKILTYTKCEILVWNMWRIGTNFSRAVKNWYVKLARCEIFGSTGLSVLWLSHYCHLNHDEF